MAVEEINKGKLGFENYKFPVGMKVLAVDDDMTCLKILEKLLQKCQYEVTTTNQAKVALEMLRENRKRFDIIITDVHMPDMDGFKLLELVGLEMDLPVIMLSVNSDPKLVMKGITHGACDYLVKPVRLEELKNIWQHIIRKKNKDTKQQTNLDTQVHDQQENNERGKRTSSNGSSDKKGKRSSKKRKDKEEQKQEEEKVEDEDEDEDYEEDYNETHNDEPGTQKKPRIVWSIDLHQKFVAAVNQLGIGKGAVPKKILEHMNVEGLTRENVASHLQKYRLYLKRIFPVATQSNILSTGGTDHYMRMNFVDSRSLAASQGRFSSLATSLYQTGSMLNRLNSSSGCSLLQTNNHSHSQSISNSFTTLNKLDTFVLQPNQNPSSFQGISRPLEPSKSISYPGNINLIATSINSLPNAQKNIIPSSQDGGIFNSRRFENASIGQYNINDGVLSSFSGNSFFSGAFNSHPLVTNGKNSSSTGSHVVNNPLDFSSNVVHDSRGFSHLKNTNNLVPFNVSSFSHSCDQIKGFSQIKTDSPLMKFENNGTSSFLQHGGDEIVTTEPKTTVGGDSVFEQWRSQAGFDTIGYDDLDELLTNSLTKGEQEGNTMIDGDFGIDDYTL